MSTAARDPMVGRGSPGGFTILEILIATAILTIGLIGILALFPIAIDSGRQVMERSTAVTIAKSVAEQIRAGIRNSKRTISTGAVPFTYFVFEHDGIQDPIPTSSSQEKPSADYYILFPQFAPNTAFEGPSDHERRRKAVQASYEFVYPEDDDPPNGGGNPARAENDGDDSPDKKDILVKKVYTVGNLLGSMNMGEGKAADDRFILEDQRRDTFKQYSFAFSIRASNKDTNMSINPKLYMPGNMLYHVRVLIYRSFFFSEEKVLQEGKGVEPIYELDFEVSK